MTQEGAALESADAATVRRVALAAAAGSSIEWFDFFIYGTAAALVFGELFFPALSPLAGTLAAFATFAVGFIARPVGGIAFGHYGDRLGRKPTLVIALVVMGTATFAIGLLPSYATIGVLAPILLVVLRFVQGLAVGGQWGGVVLLATEYAPPGKRGLYGSFAQIGVPIGVILGNGVFVVLAAVLSDAQFAAWGWRVPFLISVVLIGLAIYVQLRIEDTPDFRALQAAAGDQERPARSPIIEVLRTQPGQVLLAAGAFFTANGVFYISITGMLDYGTRQLGMPRITVLTAVLISSAVTMVVLPIAAAISDRFGRRPIYLAGAALSAVWAFPLFWLIDTRSLVLMTVALSVGSVFLSHDVRPAGGAVRRDVQRPRPLQRRLAGLPDRGGVRRRPRAADHDLAARRHRHLGVGLGVHRGHGRDHLLLRPRDRRDPRGRDGRAGRAARRLRHGLATHDRVTP